MKRYIIYSPFIVTFVINHFPHDQVHTWSEVLVAFLDSLRHWYDNVPAAKCLMERVSVDRHGPNNIERTVAWYCLQQRPTHQQLIYQVLHWEIV